MARVKNAKFRFQSDTPPKVIYTSVVRKNSLAPVLDHEYLFFDTRTHSYSSGFDKMSIERVEY